MKTTPCADPTRDPNDWFIESYGKQYREDELLTEAEVADLDSIHLTESLEPADRQRILDLAASEKKRQALVRRRKAKESCREECPIRKACLAQGLELQNLDHGIWGGYYPEERRAIEKLQRERDKVD
jgi:hypothetical protein